MIKKFKKFLLQETTLNDRQINEVNAWNHHGELDDATKVKIHNAMKLGVHDIVDLEQHNEVHPDVEEHLTRHGYDVVDYQKGLAKTIKHVGDPSRGIPMRQKHVVEKIAAVLNRTDASDDVKKAFINDENRSMKHAESDPMKVCISSTQKAIGGSSTGTHWNSCMNMVDGLNNHYLPRDSEHGQQPAYLIHESDEHGMKFGEPKKPISRILLKRFVQHDGDSIYRPEQNMYGVKNSNFANTVANWAVKNYPAKTGVEYHLHGDLYHDSDTSTYTEFGSKHIDDVLNDEPSEEADNIMFGGKSLNFHPSAIQHLSGLLYNKDLSEPQKKYTNLIAMKAVNLPAVHVNHLAKDMNFGDRSNNNFGNLLLNHSNKLNKENTKKVEEHLLKKEKEGYGGVLDQKAYLPLQFLQNKHVSDDFIKQLPIERLNDVSFHRLKPEHIEKVVASAEKGENAWSTEADLMHLFSKDHLKRYITATSKHHRAEFQLNTNKILNSPHFDQEVHDHMMMYRPEETMKLSKFANFDDALFHTEQDVKARRQDSNHIQNLALNRHVPEEEHKKVAAYFDKAIETIPRRKLESMDYGNRLFSHVPGISSEITIPDTIGKHISEKSYNHLAENGTYVNFENGRFSNSTHENSIQAMGYAKKLHDVGLRLKNELSNDDHDLDESKYKYKNHLEKYSNYLRQFTNRFHDPEFPEARKFNIELNDMEDGQERNLERDFGKDMNY